MRALLKFIRLPVAGKLLIGEVLCCVVLSRLLLTCGSFQWIFARSKRWEQRTEKYGDTSPNTELEVKLARLVGRISRRIPKASCLTQALALQMLLARRGRYAKLCIGVNRKSTGEFHAHAWLRTHRGVLIGGGSELDTFRPIVH